MTLQELSEQFSSQFSKMIVEDRLENAIQLLMEKLKEVPPGNNIDHWRFAKQQAEHLAGQLSKLNADIRQGIIPNEEKIRLRNLIRKNMQDYFQVLQQPETRPPQILHADVTGAVSKWGPAVAKVFILLSVIGLAIVIAIITFIVNWVNKETRPDISMSAIPGCSVETLAETPLYKALKIDPQKWKTLPKGMTFAAVTRAKVKDKTSFDQTYFYEVVFEGKKGWVRIDGLIKEAEGCYPQKKQEIPKNTAQVDPPQTPKEACKASTTCCLISGPLTQLHQSADLFSERLIEIPAGQILEKLGKKIYNHGGISKTTFYKVSYEGYTGWVKHEDCDYVNPACIQ